MSTTSGVSSLNTQNQINPSTTSNALNSQNLNENSFMQILVTEMENQDPSSPMDDTQFVSELAQFSSLQQMTNVSTGMKQVGSVSSLSTAISLIGKTIQALDSNGDQISGVVSGMTMSNGVAAVQVNNQTVQLTDITSVDKGSSSNQA